ncbi:hypothetical protein [Listeria welshimeri]|uniref:hypothetical protein n=1 Tax=Listeria welshimeri TaxID=1643 RepID=UPI00162A52C7|nr:hypothetical protein [Listeria welshimeri]MBC1370264.1 hypothetical protein [Listeria welshimeri]MBC1639994.1 hypothetical protein [Listeria welshimeri]MBF2353270.1 hypothetical protein [Listeria welshimeri]
MDELIVHCDNIIELIDKKYKKQKKYPGAIKDIYEAIQRTKLEAQDNRFSKNKNFFQSLARQFVDDTTHFDSPILFELDKVGEIILKLQENI